jgi:hypothetical protein
MHEPWHDLGTSSSAVAYPFMYDEAQNVNEHRGKVNTQSEHLNTSKIS